MQAVVGVQNAVFGGQRHVEAPEGVATEMSWPQGMYYSDLTLISSAPLSVFG